MFLGQGLSVLCQGFYFILLARLLGPTEYGIYSGVFAMVAVLSAYSPLGSAFTLIRHVSPAPQNFAAYWGNVLMTTLTLGSLFVTVLVMVVPRLAHSYSWGLVLCAAVSECLFAQLTDVCSRVFVAFEKLRITAMLSLSVNLLRTLLAGALLWRLHHATAKEWVLAALVVSLFAACTAVMLVVRCFGKPAFDLRLLTERTGEGCVFALSSSASAIYNNFDKAMLGHYGMNAANGIYSGLSSSGHSDDSYHFSASRGLSAIFPERDSWCSQHRCFCPRDPQADWAADAGAGTGDGSLGTCDSSPRG